MFSGPFGGLIGATHRNVCWNCGAITRHDSLARRRTTATHQQITGDREKITYAAATKWRRRSLAADCLFGNCVFAVLLFRCRPRLRKITMTGAVTVLAPRPFRLVLAIGSCGSFTSPSGHCLAETSFRVARRVLFSGAGHAHAENEEDERETLSRR